MSAKGACVFQHGIRDEAASKTVILAAGVHAIRHGNIVAANLGIAVFVQTGGVFFYQGAYFRIARF